MNFTTIHYAVTDGVVTITLDRPEARNALNRTMCEELIDAASAAAAADSVHLVLIRGNGPVFCAGADLKERKDMSLDEVRNRRMRGLAAYNALEALPMPTVAVVHGAAIGSGTEIAASCDFIVATPQATFQTPEALWGTVGATQRLPRVLGKRLAKDLMFTGRKLSAEDAKIHGLGDAHRRSGRARCRAGRTGADHRQSIGDGSAPGQALHQRGQRTRSARRLRHRNPRHRREPRPGRLAQPHGGLQE